MKRMKMRIGNNDVTLSAKYFWNAKATKKSTLNYLSYLSSVFHEASEWNREHGYDSIAERYKNESHELYMICKNAGLYNELNK